MTNDSSSLELLVMISLMVAVFVYLWIDWAGVCLGSGPCS